MLCNTDTSFFRWPLFPSLSSIEGVWHCEGPWRVIWVFLLASLCLDSRLLICYIPTSPLLHAWIGGEEQQCGVNGQFYLAANSLPLPPPLLWPTTTPSTPALVVSIHLLHNLPLRPTKQQFNCNHLARRIGSKELSGISTVKSWVSACDTIWPLHAGTPAMPNLTGLTCTVNTSSTIHYFRESERL